MHYETAKFLRWVTWYHKDKQDFTADYWINFKNKSNPFVEIDIQEKDFTKRPPKPDCEHEEKIKIGISQWSRHDNKYIKKNFALGEGKMNIMLIMFDTMSRA